MEMHTVGPLIMMTEDPETFMNKVILQNRIALADAAIVNKTR